MGDDEEAGRPGVGDLLQKAAEAVDVGVVERRVDLVQHADRRGIGQEYGEQQRDRGQRLLAARQKRHHLGLLARRAGHDLRSEEHTSELQSLMRISYAVFCLKKKKKEISKTTE